MTLARAELHLHLEGTLEPETIFRLAERNRIRLPYADVSELAARYDFTDLQSFLDLYYENMAVLRSAEDFFEMTEAYLTRAAIAGVCHAEVFLDPQAHLARGIALETVMEGVSAALESAEQRHGISTGLIICMLRDHSAESAMETLDAVVALETPIIGIGLDSTEVGISPSKFVDVFAKARALGLHRVAHAGEEGPPENIWQSLDLLKAERIDHGVRCMEDEALVSRLASQRIPLTVCPLSNVRLKVVESMSAHPLPELMRRGLLVTVNSDDPAYFGGYVDDNFAALERAFGHTDEEAALLARNSITASFLDDARKSSLYAAIADEQAGRPARAQSPERAALPNKYFKLDRTSYRRVAPGNRRARARKAGEGRATGRWWRRQECAVEPGLVVNGRTRKLGEVGGHVTLLEWLRASGLTGCKEGCAEGECGACAILVARDDGRGGSRWVAINACLVPAAAFDQQEVVTAEGLGQPGQLHPVQREMARRGGSQCGYCTPGFICSMAAEYYRPGRRPPTSGAGGLGDGDRLAGSPPPPANTAPVNGAPIAAEAEQGPNGFDLHALSGNLCRCTGYRPIRDAAYALGQPTAHDPFAARQAQPAPRPAVTSSSSPQGRYVRPVDLTEALALLAAHPAARLVAGSTDWGVELNIRHARAKLTIGIERLEELREFSVGPDRIDLGAALSLSEIESRLAGRVPLLDDLFPQFASRLIRNGATLGGNLGTASPIGDAPPVLLALGASLVLASARGEREVELADYFTGYRQSVKRPDELIKTVRVPLPLAPLTAFHKIAKRRFDDISSVAVAYALRLDAGQNGDPVVGSIKIGLGGVAATPLRALAAEEALTRKPWTREVAEAAARELARAGTPISDHRASSRYRIAMLGSSLLKFHAETPALAY